jgi:hypothetical protein
MKSKRLTVVAGDLWGGLEPTVIRHVVKAGMASDENYVIGEEVEQPLKPIAAEGVRLRRILATDEKRMLRINRRLRGERVDDETSSASDVSLRASSS